MSAKGKSVCVESCVCEREPEKDRERKRGGEKKGGTEWRGKERDKVRRLRNKREFVAGSPVQTDTRLIFVPLVAPACFT